MTSRAYAPYVLRWRVLVKKNFKTDQSNRNFQNTLQPKDWLENVYNEEKSVLTLQIAPICTWNFTVCTKKIHFYALYRIDWPIKMLLANQNAETTVRKLLGTLVTTQRHKVQSRSLTRWWIQEFYAVGTIMEVTLDAFKFKSGETPQRFRKIEIIWKISIQLRWYKALFFISILISIPRRKMML